MLILSFKMQIMSKTIIWVTKQFRKISETFTRVFSNRGTEIRWMRVSTFISYAEPDKLAITKAGKLILLIIAFSVFPPLPPSPFLSFLSTYYFFYTYCDKILVITKVGNLILLPFAVFVSICLSLPSSLFCYYFHCLHLLIHVLMNSKVMRHSRQPRSLACCWCYMFPPLHLPSLPLFYFFLIFFYIRLATHYPPLPFPSQALCPPPQDKHPN